MLDIVVADSASFSANLVDMCNWLYFSCISLAFVLGMCVIVSSTIFTVVAQVLSVSAIWHLIANGHASWHLLFRSPFVKFNSDSANWPTEVTSFPGAKNGIPPLQLSSQCRFDIAMEYANHMWLLAYPWTIGTIQVYFWLGSVIFTGIVKYSLINSDDSAPSQAWLSSFVIGWVRWRVLWYVEQMQSRT